jgi:hypothetical protein
MEHVTDCCQQQQKQRRKQSHFNHTSTLVRLLWSLQLQVVLHALPADGWCSLA